MCYSIPMKNLLPSLSTIGVSHAMVSFIYSFVHSFCMSQKLRTWISTYVRSDGQANCLFNLSCEICELIIFKHEKNEHYKNWKRKGTYVHIYNIDIYIFSTYKDILNTYNTRTLSQIKLNQKMMFIRSKKLPYYLEMYFELI